MIIGTGNEEIKLLFDHNIKIYCILVDINVFNSESPGVEICKVFIWTYGYSIYLCIQICI